MSGRFFRRELKLQKSAIEKRSLIINSHKTSISLEEEFWTGLKEIARLRGLTPTQMIREIDRLREIGNLSSAVRLFVLDHYQKAAT
jgi:predicted DNA-binding ribbon-helix-helix protein